MKTLEKNIFACCFLVALTVSFAPRLLAQTQPVPATAGEQTEQSFTTKDGTEVYYLLYRPKNFSAAEGGKFPLIFFLHGRGESNGPLSLVAKWGPPMMAARGDDLPVVIVSPQCPTDDSWTSEKQQIRLTELLDHVIKSNRIDEQKIFLTGLSMGGYGSWALAASHPKIFAAVVPICGGGDPADAAKLKDVPVWVFHGDQDAAIKIEESVKMVDAIKAAGGTSVRFTSLEHVGHNCWSAAYETPDLYEWMLSQTASPDSPAELASSDQPTPADDVMVDPSGTWTWERELDGNVASFNLELKTTGDHWHGILESDFGAGEVPPGFSDPITIEDVKLERDKISFTVTREFNGNPIEIHYSGVIAGNEILGTAEMDFDGNVREMEWRAKR